MILVTGGTGLLGSHLVIDLFKNGESIRVLSRNSSWPDSFIHLLEFYNIDVKAFNKNVELIQGDICDIVSLEDALIGCDFIYHCAGLVSFEQSDYRLLMEINVEGTSNVVNACLNSKELKKLCYVSSTAALSKSHKEALIKEDGNWTRDNSSSNYAKSKFLAEREVWRGQEEGLCTVIVNPCVILGPGNWNISSGAIFKNGSKGIKYHTKGSNAFVDVRDVSNIMIQLMESDISEDRFLVTGENAPYQEMIREVNAAFGLSIQTKLASRFMTAVARRLEAFRCFFTRSKPRLTKETVQSANQTMAFSNEKIKTLLKYEFISIKESVQFTAEYFKKYYC